MMLMNFSKDHGKAGIFVGLVTIDLVYLVRDLPRPNTKVEAQHQEIHAGGPAANAAMTFSRLGGRGTLLTVVGRHPLAEVIRRDLDRAAVALVDLGPEIAGAPSISSIWLARDTGERTVVSANAAPFSISARSFDSSILAGASVVLVDGHHMEVCIEAARQARAQSIPVVLDGGSWKDGMEELLKFVDTAICSLDFLPPGCGDSASVTGYLIAKGATEAVVTRGEKPVLYAHQSGAGEVAVPSVDAVDTLGAGDVFHGAFCYRRAAGADFVDALRFAAETASRSCGHYGIFPEG